jgi:hypothetical protein
MNRRLAAGLAVLLLAAALSALIMKETPSPTGTGRGGSGPVSSGTFARPRELAPTASASAGTLPAALPTRAETSPVPSDAEGDRPCADLVVFARDGSGRALPGAEVVWDGVAPEHPTVESWLWDDAAPGIHKTTDETGAARFERRLVPGERNIVYGRQGELAGVLAPVVAAEGQPAVTVELVLVQVPLRERLGALGGRLLADGKPVGGRRVQVDWSVPGDHYRYATVWTDLDGRYLLPDVWPGRCELRFFLTADGRLERAPSVLEVPIEENVVARRDVDLPRGTTLRGAIRLPPGKHASDLHVWWWQLVSGLGLRIVGEEAYEIPGVLPGKVSLNAELEGFVPFAADVTVRGEPVETGPAIELGRSSVSGRLLFVDGAPVDSHEVTVLDAVHDPDGAHLGATHTGADGRFQIRGLRSGAWHLYTATRKDHVEVVRKLDVAEGDLDVGDLAVVEHDPGPARLAVRVRDRGGRAIEGARVTLRVKDTSDQEVETDVAGMAPFELESPADGAVFALGGVWFSPTVPVKLEAGKTATVELVLGEKIGNVIGRVHAPQERLARKLVVEGFRQDGDDWEVPSHNSDWPWQDEVKPDGSFVLGGLQPGTWRIELASGLAEAEVLVHAGTREPVDFFLPAETASLDVRLAKLPPLAVHGELREPIPVRLMAAWEGRDGLSRGSASTVPDATGRGVLADVPLVDVILEALLEAASGETLRLRRKVTVAGSSAIDCAWPDGSGAIEGAAPLDARVVAESAEFTASVAVSEGRFHLGHLPAGRYQVHASQEGGAGPAREVDVASGVVALDLASAPK